MLLARTPAGDWSLHQLVRGFFKRGEIFMIFQLTPRLVFMLTLLFGRCLFCVPVLNTSAHDLLVQKRECSFVIIGWLFYHHFTTGTESYLSIFADKDASNLSEIRARNLGLDSNLSLGSRNTGKISSKRFAIEPRGTFLGPLSFQADQKPFHEDKNFSEAHKIHRIISLK